MCFFTMEILESRKLFFLSEIADGNIREREKKKKIKKERLTD